MKKIYSFFLCTMSVYSSFSQTVHVVNATNFVFTPTNFTAAVGDTVRFIRVNGTHTTTSTSVPAGAAPWDQPLTATAIIYNYIVSAPGTYFYKCTPHLGLGMVAQFDVSAVTPVKLIDFSASLVNGKAKLSWQTASEENSDYFSIQQSYSGMDFTDVGTTAAAGSSNSVRNYSYTVNTPGNAPFLYFRLLTVDKDKKQQYSDIVLLHLTNSTEASFMKGMYPNPAENGDHLHLNFNSERNEKLVVTIFETSGKQLFSMPITAVEGVNQTHLPLPKLRKGNYYVQFILSNKKQTLPLFIK